jgi:hypothetical protein
MSSESDVPVGSSEDSGGFEPKAPVVRRRKAKVKPDEWTPEDDASDSDSDGKSSERTVKQRNTRPRKSEPSPPFVTASHSAAEPACIFLTEYKGGLSLHPAVIAHRNDCVRAFFNTFIDHDAAHTAKVLQWAIMILEPLIECSFRLVSNGTNAPHAVVDGAFLTHLQLSSGAQVHTMDWDAARLIIDGGSIEEQPCPAWIRFLVSVAKTGGIVVEEDLADVVHVLESLLKSVNKQRKHFFQRLGKITNDEKDVLQTVSEYSSEATRLRLPEVSWSVFEFDLVQRAVAENADEFFNSFVPASGAPPRKPLQEWLVLQLTRQLTRAHTSDVNIRKSVYLILGDGDDESKKEWSELVRASKALNCSRTDAHLFIPSRLNLP